MLRTASFSWIMKSILKNWVTNGNINGELVLTGYILKEGKSEEQIVEEIKSATGWDLRVASKLREGRIPLEKLKMLRLFDPDRCSLRSAN